MTPSSELGDTLFCKWRIFQEYVGEIDKAILPDLVLQKCAIKDASFMTVDDLFQARLMEFLQEWDKWLEPIIPLVPSKDMVISELKKQLKRVFPKYHAD